MSEKVIKLPFKGKLTAQKLFATLSEDEDITDAIIVYKKKIDEDETFCCECTSMSMPDMCMAKDTMVVTVQLVLLGEMESET